MATKLPAWRFALLAAMGLILAAGAAVWLASPVLLALLGVEK